MKVLFSLCSWMFLWIATLSWFAACSASPTKPDGEHQATHQQPGAEASANAGVETPGTAAPGEKLKQYDLNHDNKPDVWAYFGQMTDPDNPSATKEALVRKEWDFNFDGKVDIRRFFNFKGEIAKDELDLDFDGRFDVVTYYQGGVRQRQSYDFNFDSKPDYWKYYEKNVLVRTERDRDFNGRVDYWEYYKDGKLDRIGMDQDGDGQIDKWIQQPAD